MSGRASYAHRRRELIPIPSRSDVDLDRFCHRDLKFLSPGDIWAERVLITHELADRAFHRRRPRCIDGESGCTDVAWLGDRLARLEAAARRRP